MKIKAISFVIVCAGLMFGGISQSFADFKWYAGSECVRWDESIDPATYINSSRRFNPSTTRRLRLDCPSIHDRGANILGSFVRVIDRHPGDRVCARMVAVRQIDSSFVSRSGPRTCTGTAWNSPNPVVLNTGGLTGIWSDMYYYHSVYQIPARYEGRSSGVVSYYVSEFNGFD
ncbi:MAG: hypothetical protein V3U87_07065 [Methylococcaceae bacterium]